MTLYVVLFVICVCAIGVRIYPRFWSYLLLLAYCIVYPQYMFFAALARVLPSKYRSNKIIHEANNDYIPNANNINFWSIPFIHELRTLCLSYIGIVIDSAILTCHEQQQLYSLLLSQRQSFVRKYEPKYNVLNGVEPHTE
eukprot:823984_1